MLGLVNLSGLGTIALPTGGLAAVDARLRLSFAVDEPEMFVRFRVQCAIESGADDVVDWALNLIPDGGAAALIGGGALFRVGISAAPAAETHKGVAFEWFAKLPQGRHVIELQADQVGAASENIDTDVAPCLFIAERVTNEKVLAHGVESKVFNVQ